MDNRTQIKLASTNNQNIFKILSNNNQFKKKLIYNKTYTRRYYLLLFIKLILIANSQVFYLILYILTTMCFSFVYFDKNIDFKRT